MNRNGWVPAHLHWRGPEASVDWCWLGGQRFLDPFFDDTIEIALKKPFNRLFMHRTPIAELGAWHAASPGMMPAGFIFHMSRCGSTLISQMLAALPQTVVISEASPIDWLARTTRVSEPVRSQWLRWMVSALGQRRSGTEAMDDKGMPSRYFIKFDSITAMALPFIRRVFPSVPWLFAFRNPEDVLLSQMRETAAAMTPGIVTDLSIIDASLTAEEYAARVIGRLCECAAKAMDDKCMLVNYSQLPEIVWTDIAAHFNLDLQAHNLARMQQTASRDAKRPGTSFQNIQRAVPTEVRAAAAQWILPQYNELERIRQTSVAARRRRQSSGTPAAGTTVSHHDS